MKRFFPLSLAVLAAVCLTLPSLDASAQQDRPPKVGDTAPNIKAKTLDGKEFELKKMRDKLVLVDFWGTWCPPCRAEVPHLKEAYEKYGKKGFEIVSVSLNDTRKKLKSFTDEHEMDWIHILDEDHEHAKDYHVRAVPSPFLVDHNGKIVALPHELRGKGLLAKVEKHVKELPPKGPKTVETE